jgi:protein gp37
MQELNPRELRFPADCIDWVICGAETGPGARPMDLNWARELRDQCQDADIPFFFKRASDGSRELDGREWNEYPAEAGEWPISL